MNTLEISVVLFLSPYFSNCYTNWYKQCLQLQKNKSKTENKTNFVFTQHLSSISSWEQSKILDYSSNCMEYVSKELLITTILHITNSEYKLKLNHNNITIDYQKFIFNIFCLTAEFLRSRYELFVKHDYVSIDHYIEKAITIALYKLIPLEQISKRFNHTVEPEHTPDIKKIGYILEENQKKQHELNKKILEIIDKSSLSISSSKSYERSNNGTVSSPIHESTPTKEILKNFIANLKYQQPPPQQQRIVTQDQRPAIGYPKYNMHPINKIPQVHN